MVRSLVRRPKAGLLSRGPVVGLVLCLLLCLTGALAGSWWGAGREATASARSLILINPLEGNPFSPDAGGDRLVNLETEAQLVTSDTVARLVAERTTPGPDGSAPSAESMLAGVTVDVPANTQLIEITVESADPAVATARAQAFAETFLAHRRDRTEASVFDRRAEVDERIREQTQELATKASELDAAREGSARATLLQQQITDLTTQMGLLRTQFAGLQAASYDPGQVVTPAAVVPVGLLGSRHVAAGIGALLGLGLALGVVVARVRRDTTVRRPGDVLDAGLVVAGHLRPGSPETAWIDGVPVGRAADEPEAERLRAAVLTREPARPFVVLVAAVGRNTVGVDARGTARSAGVLAAALARAQLEVVHVDLATRDDPEAGDRAGISDILLGRSSADEELRSSAPHLWSLAAGSAVERLDDLVASPEMGLLVQELGKLSDAVVVRAAGLDLPSTHVLMRYADLVLLEATTGHCRLEELEAATAAVTRAGRESIGVCLVDPPRRETQRRRTGEEPR